MQYRRIWVFPDSTIFTVIDKYGQDIDYWLGVALAALNRNLAHCLATAWTPLSMDDECFRSYYLMR